jgi:hypothetical protein
MANYRAQDGRTTLDVSANTTLAKDTHTGVVVNVVSDGKTITLPAAAAGVMFRVRNGGAQITNAPVGTGANYTVAVTIAPNGTDTIGGAGRAAANSNLVNTKATARVGDEVTLLGVSGAWQIVSQIGTWA